MIDTIVAAATEVMGEDGAAALSLGEVARRVGMRTPSLYGYFESRAELCDEIFRRGWVDFAGVNADLVIGPGADLTDQLRQRLLDAVTWADQHRAEAELMFWRPIPHWQPSPEAFAAAVDAVSATARTLAEAQQAGLLRADADVEEMTEVFGVIFSGVISQQLSNEPGVDAATGRISRHAHAFAAMFTHRYGTG